MPCKVRSGPEPLQMNHEFFFIFIFLTTSDDDDGRRQKLVIQLPINFYSFFFLCGEGGLDSLAQSINIAYIYTWIHSLSLPLSRLGSF